MPAIRLVGIALIALCFALPSRAPADLTAANSRKTSSDSFVIGQFDRSTFRVAESEDAGTTLFPRSSAPPVINSGGAVCASAGGSLYPSD
jgi:hypothetical protein